MVYSSKNEAYLNEKNQFFSQVSSQLRSKSKFETIDTQAKTMSYKFLLENQSSLETEFTDMYKLLQKQGDKNKEVFWLYCYYCASLLESFYQAYDKAEKVVHYASIRQKIKDQLNKKKAKKHEETSFIDSMYQSFTGGFRNLATAPAHLGSLKGYSAYLNICRIYWVFCRLTMIEGLKLARDLKIIEQLDLILGTHTDVDRIISIFRAPTFITNYLSVGLLLTRFMIDGGLLLRHTFFPSEQEGQESTTAWDRFKFEIYKRQGSFFNDIGWGFINLITNFPQLLNITGTTAGYITSVYLVTDIALILYLNYWAQQEFLLKKDQYLKEIEDYKNPELHKEKSQKQKDAHIDMLHNLLNELNMNRRTKEATSYFAAAAATLLMTGFTASMFVNPAFMVAASYFVCNLGVAMYLSVGSFSKYKEKAVALEQAQTNPIALKEYEVAKNEFIFTLTKNSLMPTTLILSFALYWPAALVFTAAYLGYELYHAHDQHSEKTAINELINEEIESENSHLISM